MVFHPWQSIHKRKAQKHICTYNLVLLVISNFDKHIKRIHAVLVDYYGMKLSLLIF